MKTVLFCWELGGGAGHATLLSRLAERLGSRDIRIIVAAKDPAAFRSARGMSEVIQTPPWPGASLSPAARDRTSSASFGDILSTAGLSDAAALSRLLDWWDALLSSRRPDLVVGVMAPAAALAARGRLPVVLVGNGYALPPCDTPTFPPLHQMTQPQREGTTLAILNGVLDARRMRPLDRLPQLFAADARMVFSFPLLDPYAAYRKEQVYGPTLAHDPVAAGQGGRQTVFVYFARGYPVHPDIPACLLPHAPSLRIYAPDLSVEDTARLKAAGAHIEAAPVAPAEALANARLVVHFGGALLASESLLAGVPQLVLSMHIEQWLTGAALETAGVGKVLAAYDPAPLAFDLASLSADAALRSTALEEGEIHRALFRRMPNPLAALADRCHAFLDGRTLDLC